MSQTEMTREDKPAVFLRILGCAAICLGVALAVGAADPPHWSSTTMNVDCTSQCHVTHQAQGGGLTSAGTNVALCQSCHVAGGLGGALPINNADKAVPASHTGDQHAFDVAAVDPGFATQLPLSTEMNLRVMSSNIVCSTCHNQHAAASGFRGDSRVGSAVKTVALGGSGSVSSGGTYTGAQGAWYLVQIVTAGNETTARFRYSKDNGVSWFPTAPATLAAGAAVALDSGVTATFSTGNYVLGERWQFPASWPFLRAAMDLGANGAGDAFCRDCHRSWVMDTAAVETWNGSVRSHPVGITYPVSSASYRSTPLDGNWQPQGGAGADANPTNDLKTDGAGYLQCLSCHGVHYADSNTQTVDGP